MTQKEIGLAYLEYLGKGETNKIIGLFDQNGLVISPLYGTQPASSFYEKLSEDTAGSVLKLDGIFTEKETNRMSILFDYEWELRNGKTVNFKVVDVIEFNNDLKIKKLTIIYDTVEAKAIWESMHQSEKR